MDDSIKSNEKIFKSLSINLQLEKLSSLDILNEYSLLRKTNNPSAVNQK